MPPVMPSKIRLLRNLCTVLSFVAVKTLAQYNNIFRDEKTTSQGFKAPLLVDCCLWLNVCFRIEADIRRNAYCLSRRSNAESGADIKPRRACPEAHTYGVALLENGTTIFEPRAWYLYASGHAEAAIN